VAVKIALPKGRLMRRTAALLQMAGWGLDGYHEKARFYHLASPRFTDVSAKIFHERDIPIQVSIGNYDLGICGGDWLAELLAKYPSSALVKIRELGYGTGSLYIVTSPQAPADSVKGTVRIASEYPNLAESYALKKRLSRFSIFPVWGGAEAYPPENATLALVRARNEAEIARSGMEVVGKVLNFSACLVVNRHSWESKDLNQVVASICDHCDTLPPEEESLVEESSATEAPAQYLPVSDGALRLALPDGHQQEAMMTLLGRAGLVLDDYPSASGNRRPTINLEGVTVKVIRPQDMPLQVANGNFDLAIGGRDWLLDHRYQFPTSPVKELLDLKMGWVKVVAVVAQDMPAADVLGLRRMIENKAISLRVASEYVNIADKYARDNRLGQYRIIPTWGATEAFLPDDADLLIENTQTGSTIARHNLKIIDTLFESTACLIGNSRTKSGSRKASLIRSIIETLRAAVEEV